MEPSHGKLSRYSVLLFVPRYPVRIACLDILPCNSLKLRFSVRRNPTLTVPCLVLVDPTYLCIKLRFIVIAISIVLGASLCPCFLIRLRLLAAIPTNKRFPRNPQAREEKVARNISVGVLASDMSGIHYNERPEDKSGIFCERVGSRPCKVHLLTRRDARCMQLIRMDLMSVLKGIQRSSCTLGHVSATTTLATLDSSCIDQSHSFLDYRNAIHHAFPKHHHHHRRSHHLQHRCLHTYPSSPQHT